MEIIDVNTSLLTIKEQSLFKARTKTYDVNGVSDFRYKDGEGVSNELYHEGDLTHIGGYNQARAIVNSVVQDGAVSFSYEGRTISFGKGLPSWEAEKVGIAIIDASNKSICLRKKDEIDIENEIL